LKNVHHKQRSGQKVVACKKTLTAHILSAKVPLQSLNDSLSDGTSNTKERNNFLKMFQFAGMTFRWFCKAINETFPMDPANPTMVGIYRFRIFLPFFSFHKDLLYFSFTLSAALFHPPACTISPTCCILWWRLFWQWTR
jgi:hypothetical protein